MPALGLLVERRESGERGAIGAELVEHGAVREDRLGDVGQSVGERPSDADHQGAPCVAVVRLALARAENLDELAASSRPLVEAVERGERLVVARVVLEARLPRVDRAARIVEHALAQLAEPPEQIASRVRAVLELHLGAQDVASCSGSPST